MPVSYFEQASTPGPSFLLRIFFGFWKGSCFKLLIKEILIFLGLYYSLAILYLCVLNDTRQQHLETVAIFIEKNLKTIKLSFMLNIFMTLVYTRYTNHYMNLPWMMGMSQVIGAHWRGRNPYERLLRRTVARYITAAFALCSVRISSQMRKKFSDKDHYIFEGILSDVELVDLERDTMFHAQPFKPLIWAINIVSKAYEVGMIKSKNGYASIIRKMAGYHGVLVSLFIMHRINYSLVYVQVVCLSVYMYTFSCVLARQKFKHRHKNIDNTSDAIIFLPPILSLCEIIVYLGLNKLTMSMQSPLGEDDSDFNVIDVYDSNKEISVAFQDNKEYTCYIPLERDVYFGHDIVILPQTKTSKWLMSKCGDYVGSQWSKRQMEIFSQEYERGHK